MIVMPVDTSGMLNIAFESGLHVGIGSPVVDIAVKNIAY